MIQSVCAACTQLYFIFFIQRVTNYNFYFDFSNYKYALQKTIQRSRKIVFFYKGTPIPVQAPRAPLLRVPLLAPRPLGN